MSWTIRKQDGASCNCANAAIAEVQLLATRCDTLLPDGTCDGFTQRIDEWACSEAHGTTLFDIKEGRWAFEIRPVTPNGRDADALVPPPIVRDVITGEVAMLDALQITTNVCNTP